MTLENLSRLSIPLLYLLTGTLWLLLAAKVPQLLPQAPIPSAKLRRITIFATVVAVALGIDCMYWLFANLSRYGFLPGESGVLDQYLRVPWRVFFVKIPLLVSAVAFYFVLKTSSAALASETEQIYFSRFVEYTWDAVCITDTEGRVRQWNHGAVNLFGFTKAAVIGKNLKEFLVPRDLHDETDRIWTEIKDTKLAKSDYHALRHTSSGQLVPIDISISPILEGPHLRGYFGIMREALTNPRSRYFRRTNRPQRSRAYAFVIMPFSKDIVRTDVWGIAISEAVKEVGLRAVRADTETLSGQVMDQIYSDIRDAKVIIADLSGSNPNVFYELGIAQAIDKPVVQIISKGSRLPFDVQGIRTIEYDPEDLVALRSQLVTSLKRQLA